MFERPVPVNLAGELPSPFIVGVGRSGTTLLRLMLDAHPALAIPSETHFLLTFVNGPCRPITRRQFLRCVTEAAAWPNMALDVEDLRREIASIGVFTVAEGVRAFYRLYANGFGKCRWGDKTPPYRKKMTAIAELLPEAHFIHIVRDGRDTALSYRGLWFGPGEDVETAAHFWVAQIMAARAQSKRLPHYMEVRYEDLVREPEQVLRAITTYLALEFDPAMLRYYETAADRLAELRNPVAPAGNQMGGDRFRAIHAHTMRPPDPGRIGNWRSEMSRDEQDRFDVIAGPLLAELGYETRFKA